MMAHALTTIVRHHLSMCRAARWRPVERDLEHEARDEPRLYLRIEPAVVRAEKLEVGAEGAEPLVLVVSPVCIGLLLGRRKEVGPPHRIARSGAVVLLEATDVLYELQHRLGKRPHRLENVAPPRLLHPLALLQVGTLDIEEEGKERIGGKAVSPVEV